MQSSKNIRCTVKCAAQKSSGRAVVLHVGVSPELKRGEAGRSGIPAHPQLCVNVVSLSYMRPCLRTTVAATILRCI